MLVESGIYPCKSHDKTKEPEVFCTINSISKLVNHPKEIHHHHIHHWVEISGPKKNI